MQLEKWFPLQGKRAHSLYFWSFQKQNREEGEEEQKQQTYHFTKVITSITDYKYTTLP